MKTEQDKKHGKIYTTKPRTLTIICQLCKKHYVYQFLSIQDDLWYKELQNLKCPFCGKKRI